MPSNCPFFLTDLKKKKGSSTWLTKDLVILSFQEEKKLLFKENLFILTKISNKSNFKIDTLLNIFLS